jgi:phage terminase small subunit
LESLRNEQQHRTQITSDRVLQELAKIGFANFKNYLDESNNIVGLDTMNTEITAAVQSIQIERKTIGEQPVDITKFKLHDKLHALELIGKHLGMFVDRIKNEGDMQITVNRKLIGNSKSK